MAKLDKLYARSPVWLQNAMVSTYGLYWHWARFGGNYSKSVEAYQQREFYKAEQWMEFQNQQLKQLLSICLDHVPYYRDNWSISEKNSAKRGLISDLPLLEKEPLREDPKRFWRDDLRPFPKLNFYTSGTTGTSIATRFSLSELRESLAIREARSLRWAGVTFKEPRATFSGRLVEPDPEKDEHIYRFNAVENQVYFSAFHLKPTTAHRYVQALKRHNITWMTGYSVSFYLLARHIIDQGLKVPTLKAVITTSEKLTAEMRTVMQRAYGCRIYEEYSTVENALFVSECEHGCLHLSPESGIVEILKPDGSYCLPGEIGEVVTTCLTRTFQPLVRFRLGDLAVWDDRKCPCGREMPVIKEVVGRLEDVVTGPDGRQLVRFHGIFVDQPNILEGQIIQENLKYFMVEVVSTKNFSEKDVVEITKRMTQRLGSDVEIVVKQVDKIPRTAAGKFKAVVSNLRHD